MKTNLDPLTLAVETTAKLVPIFEKIYNDLNTNPLSVRSNLLKEYSPEITQSLILLVNVHLLEEKEELQEVKFHVRKIAVARF